MEKEEIIRFFDRCAPSWDLEMIRNEEVIAQILDNAGICPEIDVLENCTTSLIRIAAA